MQHGTHDAARDHRIRWLDLALFVSFVLDYSSFHPTIHDWIGLGSGRGSTPDQPT